MSSQRPGQRLESSLWIIIVNIQFVFSRLLALLPWGLVFWLDPKVFEFEDGENGGRAALQGRAAMLRPGSKVDNLMKDGRSTKALKDSLGKQIQSVHLTCLQDSSRV